MLEAIANAPLWPMILLSVAYLGSCWLRHCDHVHRDQVTEAYLETDRHSRTLLLASGLPQGEVSEALTRMRTQAGYRSSVVMQARWHELGQQLDQLRQPRKENSQ